MNNSLTGIDRTWYHPNITSIGEIQADPYKTSNRYEKKILITDPAGQHIQFIQKRWIPKASKDDQLVYIDTRYQYRPDIISVDYYNTPLHAWAIMSANGIRSVFELEAGTYIKIPNIARVLGGLN